MALLPLEYPRVETTDSFAATPEGMLGFGRAGNPGGRATQLWSAGKAETENIDPDANVDETTCKQQ